MLIIKGNLVVKHIYNIDSNTPPPQVIAFGDLKDYDLKSATIVEGDLIIETVRCNDCIIATEDVVIIEDIDHVSK